MSYALHKQIVAYKSISAPSYFLNMSLGIDVVQLFRQGHLTILLSDKHCLVIIKKIVFGTREAETQCRRINHTARGIVIRIVNRCTYVH